jgi:hypothetical protein
MAAGRGLLIGGPAHGFATLGRMADWGIARRVSYLGFAKRIDGILHWAEQEIGSTKADPSCRFRAYKEALLVAGNLTYPSYHPSPPGSRDQALLVEALFQVPALLFAVDNILLGVHEDIARTKLDIVLDGQPLPEDTVAAKYDTAGRVARDNLVEFIAASILHARMPTSAPPLHPCTCGRQTRAPVDNPATVAPGSPLRHVSRQRQMG